MQETNIILKIKSLINSIVLQRVGFLILEDPHKLINYTIVDLANNTDTSVGSIVRFCKELGFNSYTEFKTAITIELVTSDVRNSEQDENYKSKGKIIDNILKISQTTLEQTSETLDSGKLQEIAHLISETTSVVINGVGASYISAEHLSFKLSRLGIHTQVLKDIHKGLYLSLTPLKKVCIFISATGTTEDVILLATSFKERDNYCIAITNSINSPLSKICHMTLATTGIEDQLKSGELSSKISQMIVIEAIADYIRDMSPERDAIYNTIIKNFTVLKEEKNKKGRDKDKEKDQDQEKEAQEE